MSRIIGRTLHGVGLLYCIHLYNVGPTCTAQTYIIRLTHGWMHHIEPTFDDRQHTTKPVNVKGVASLWVVGWGGFTAS